MTNNVITQIKQVRENIVEYIDPGVYEYKPSQGTKFILVELVASGGMGGANDFPTVDGEGASFENIICHGGKGGRNSTSGKAEGGKGGIAISYNINDIHSIKGIININIYNGNDGLKGEYRPPFNGGRGGNTKFATGGSPTIPSEVNKFATPGEKGSGGGGHMQSGGAGSGSLAIALIEIIDLKTYKIVLGKGGFISEVPFCKGGDSFCRITEFLYPIL